MSVAGDKGVDVDVCIGDVDVRRSATGLVLSVVEGVATADGGVAVNWTVIEAAVTGIGPAFGRLARRKKRIKRMIATINLKRS